MRKPMRIVGLNTDNIFIQRLTNRDWEQTIISLEEFKNLMETEFPDYLKEFKSIQSINVTYNYEMANFFFNYEYGDGRTYIFE